MFHTFEQVNHFLDERKRGKILPGLDRVENLLETIDHPEEKFKSIHVAGTNGKGSTVAYIATSLEINNYKVGTFTSPSIVKRNDMIQINKRPISDQSFLEQFNRLLPGINALDQQGNPPSSFEIIVAIAFGYYDTENVDIALIEAGMGGLEDATNCLNPILSIITTIGTDHSDFLGKTYQEIALHKAGIIKRQTPVILGEVPKQAESVVQATAKQNNARLLQLGADFYYQNSQLDQNKKETFTFKTEKDTFKFTLVMHGKHQVHNASLAVMALLMLEGIGFSRATSDIENTIGSTKLIGRFEQIATNPIVIIDGAHNAEGIAGFIETVKRYFPAEKKQLLFAAFADKPLTNMINQVDDQFDKVVFTSFDHPRAAEASELYQYSTNKNREYQHNWQEALNGLLKNEADQTITFVTGSLDFIGKVRGFFEK
ncbi:bifunctional folylpolyglutamate synthase/dihydrofolate synthase [Paraliobacillus quinghaiensis]|uniref:tetrahydrofolate synthase n=1 Tax=Paraliobacillus quinghaiensis TaxID=470815 RepID=A0A917WTR1_9BACI|nr:folylpolyglutamate synthase/dihydrofolate synthase family protein [Paraliobacillus quinghaiensis]GGM27237.1 bifunctional folylpolyglutamate synthase/dihydrofolate synthase [Paraliobacillus quinghaiensis]